MLKKNITLLLTLKKNMKKVIILVLVCVGLTFASCKKDKNCKECTGWKTLAPATLCEEDFEKTSNFNDQVQNYQSDGCICNTKKWKKILKSDYWALLP